MTSGPSPETLEAWKQRMKAKREDEERRNTEQAERARADRLAREGEPN